MNVHVLAGMNAYADFYDGDNWDIISDAGMQGRTGITGLMEIGTTPQIPDGMPGTLFVSMDEQIGMDWFDWMDWHLEITDFDTGDTLLEVDNDTGDCEVDILTGQVLEYELYVEAEKDAMYGGYYEAGSELTVDFSADAVPEPATVGLLGLGMLTLLRRRRK